METHRISEGFAELYGAMIGDGCLSSYFSRYDNRQRFCLLLTGHTHDAYYYENVIRPLFFREFGMKGCIRLRKKDNTVRFETLSRSIFDCFKSLGFPVGLKRRLKIPFKISSNNRLSISCIRGIFDTDGSIYKRYSKKYCNHSRLYNYQVIQFKLNSINIIKQIKDILWANKIKTTKIWKDGNSFVLRITSQKDVHSFMSLVKPHNRHHTERYLNGLKFSGFRMGS